MTGTATSADTTTSPIPTDVGGVPAAPERVVPTAAELATADDLGIQCSRFMRVMNKAKSRLSGLVPGSIEHSTFPIIAALVHGGPSRASTIAEQLHADISTISRQTSALVQAGLLERQADPDDGRACLLAPTDAGRALFDRARASRNHWLALTLHDWPKPEVEQLIGLLDRLNDDLAEQLSVPYEPEGNHA